MTQYWQIDHPTRPTFFLDSRIQGILTAEHAVIVANAVMGLEEGDTRTMAYRAF